MGQNLKPFTLIQYRTATHSRKVHQVLQLLLLTSHHSQPLTVQTMSLLLQPLQATCLSHGTTMDTKQLRGVQQLPMGGEGVGGIPRVPIMLCVLFVTVMLHKH